MTEKEAQRQTDLVLIRCLNHQLAYVFFECADKRLEGTIAKMQAELSKLWAKMEDNH